MRYFLTIISINRIDLYISSIEIYTIYLKLNFTYLVYSYLVFYISHNDFNAPKSLLYIEKSAAD